MYLQTHLQLPVRKSQPPASQDILPSPSVLQCAVPESLGDDQIKGEINSLEVLADDETGKPSKMKPERTTPKPSLSRAGTGVKAPEQPRLTCKEMPSTTFGGFRHANVIARAMEQGGRISLPAVVGVKPHVQGYTINNRWWP